MKSKSLPWKIRGFLAIAAVFATACSESDGVQPLEKQSSATKPRPAVGTRATRRRQTPIYTIVYDFPQHNGKPVNPSGPLFVSPGGTIYGTTVDSWANDCHGPCGGGTVYQIDPQTGAEQLVYAFGAANPETGVVEDANGALYGTTPNGGSGTSYGCGSGCGVIFKVIFNGSTWSLKVLHNFSGGTDGTAPSGPLLLSNGALFGVTSAGGSENYGTIFKINTNGSGYEVIHTFINQASGELPLGPLTVDSNGILYGTTAFGGGASCDTSAGCGSVYKLAEDGSGFAVLYAFKGINGADSAEPEAGVTLVNGNLYGTTAAGGNSACASFGNDPAGCGTVFELVPSGGGAYGESTLYGFSPTSDGVAPIPSGLLAVGADLYGTTSTGGPCIKSLFPDGCGTIFFVTTSGAYELLRPFEGPSADGAYPWGGTPLSLLANFPNPPYATAAQSAVGAALAVDSTGAIWGSTSDGGSGSCSNYGCGIIYKFLVSGTKRPRQP